jgi:hypothetical protein
MKNNILKIDGENGLTIIGDSFLAESGFKYASGFRNFGNLRIVEEVAGGTAVAFLCGIKVFDKEGTLIIDKRIEKGFHFEREAVRKIVLNELLSMLIDVNEQDENFDIENARRTIDYRLKQAYFESSYNAINTWALELGIISNQ